MLTDIDLAQRKEYKPSELFDEFQLDAYKQMASTSYLSDKQFFLNFIEWNTFFRRNFHRYAMDGLKIPLYPYQSLTMYELGINNSNVIVAARGDAKSLLIALYGCERSILYPGSKTLLTSATKGQSELIVTEKIESELMAWSPMLAREIESIKSNQNKTVVKFKNGSKITVVVAGESARGNRSNVIVREEFRQIQKKTDDAILSPCQILRKPPYMLKNPYYQSIPQLKEQPVDIYISSSWYDDGHWMWKLVDDTWKQVQEGKPSCLLAFDEAVVLKHEIKSMEQLLKEKRKIDPLSWALEYLNIRLQENKSAYFKYTLFQQNQRSKHVFYPRNNLDFRAGRKNPYAIPKQHNEIRIISCDMAFVVGNKNDNSIFSCLRCLPEKITFTKEGADNIDMDNGFRVSIPYMEGMLGGGGDGIKQACRIRQLYEDFDADYIVLDFRNGGSVIYSLLARALYDEDRGVEYSPLAIMNGDDKTFKDKKLPKVDGAKECIYCISASKALNSTIAQTFRQRLAEGRIDLLVGVEQAKEEILCNIKEYMTTPDADEQIYYEKPFLETQAMISESINLVYEKDLQSGAITIYETASNRKDRYTSVSYGVYFASLLEQSQLIQAEEYEYSTFIN